LAASLDASTAKAQEIKSLRAQLKALNPAQQAAIAPQAKALDEHLESLMENGTNAQAGGAHRGLERVNADILSLYTQVLEADAAPTRAQQSAADNLSKEWQSILAAAAKIWQDDLAPLNQALTRARMPALRSDAVAPEEGESSDEE